MKGDRRSCSSGFDALVLKLVPRSRPMVNTTGKLCVCKQSLVGMDDDDFLGFLDAHREAMARISRATRGESSPEDVHAEAWLLVVDLKSRGTSIDWRDPAHQELVLRHLYQQLVRYTELNVRYAVRLDHGMEEGESHPLAHLLQADEMSDPETALISAQEQTRLSETIDLNAQQSLAGAYLYLLGHLGNRMGALADHLRISLSYCYRRCAHARIWAVHQQAFPAAAMRRDPAFMPGAWRRFRLQREPVQLSLDFDWSDGLFSD